MLIILLVLCGFAASAMPNLPMSQWAAEDVQTAVAVAAYNKQEALKAYREDIFEFLERCDNPNPSLEEVEALSETFEKMGEVFSKSMKSYWVALKFRIGARRAKRSFHDVGQMPKNALEYFHSIQRDVAAGNFASCKAKLNFAMQSIDPEVLEEIMYGKFTGEPVSLLAD